MEKAVKKAMAMICVLTITVSVLSGCGINEKNGSSTAGQIESAAETGEGVSQTNKVIDQGATSIDVVYHTLETSTYPFQPASPGFQSFQYYVFETLFTLAEDGSGPEPLIATNYAQTDADGYVWDISIKDYVYDSNGNHITSSDVVWSMLAQRDSGNWAAQFSRIADVEALDEYKVRVTMSDNSFGIFELMLTNAIIISQKAFEESKDDMATGAVGTGRYVIDKFVSGSSMTMSVNSNYWETDESKLCWISKANVDQITCHYVTENNQREIALESGIADVVNYIAASSKDIFAGDDNIGVYETEEMNLALLLLSGHENSPCSDLRVRQAIAYGLDQQTIIDVAFGGAGSVAQNSVERAGDFNPEWKNTEYYAYNPGKARELLAEAGYAPGECHLRMIFAAAGKSRGEIVQTLLNEAGFDVELIQYESALYMSYVNDPAQYDLALTNNGSTYNAVYYNNMYNQKAYNGTTAQGIKDDTLQALIEKVGDRNHTQEDVDNVFRYLNENVINTPLCRMHTITMYHKDCGLEEFVTTNEGARLYNCCIYSWNK
ncbi:ABC transporter substrate-binding protein [Hungatella hathewayi]